MKKILFDSLIISLSLFFLNVYKGYGQEKPNELIDCSEAYGEKPGTIFCERISCPEKYASFIGTWEGPLEAYDNNLKSFRPYQNTVTYTENDCYKNPKTGDVFIIGRVKDIYDEYKGQPQKVVNSLLITGLNQGDTQKPFLKTIDAENGVIEYKKVFTDIPTELSIWKYTHPAKEKQPEMTFTIMDGRDINETKINKRIIAISLLVGTEKNPYWQGIIVKGFHSKK